MDKDIGNPAISESIANTIISKVEGLLSDRGFHENIRSSNDSVNCLASNIEGRDISARPIAALDRLSP
jgi:hypothetical protein